jgi:hypothetical protein
MLRGMGWGLVCVLFLVPGWAAGGHAQADVSPTQGSIAGTILDAQSAQPVIAATVEVVGREDSRTRTDLDGKFTMLLPPGTYRIRIAAPLYESTILENVVVTAGKPIQLSAGLKPRVSSSLEVIEIVADVTEATEATQLLKRRLSPSVGDWLGSESISKTPDSHAAEVVTRLPAVTIKDNKFIIVRGLGERYSAALLNRSRLPSPDPNRRIVPLDLFPADFIESLTIVKSYTPDLPGDFSAGLVDLHLAEPPVQLSYDLSLSLSFNTQTTFQRFHTYDGSRGDWFTLGDGFRDLPSIFGEPIDNDAPPWTANATTPQMRALVDSLPNNWDIHSERAPPNLSIDGRVGTTWGPFGFNLTAVYGWKFSRRRESLNNFTSPQEIENPTGGNLFTYDRSTFETTLGAVLATQYSISPNHKLFGRGLINRKGVDEVLDGSGKTESQPDRLQLETFTQYRTDQLGMGQLEGRHHLSWFDVDWRAAWAPTNENQPDTKQLIYLQQPEDPQPRLSLVNQFGPQRSFVTLDEFLQDYSVDFSLPFKTRLPFTEVWSGLAAQIKTGLAYTLRDRSFLLRTFRNSEGLIPLPDPTLPAGEILVPSNYSTRGPVVFHELGPEPFEGSHEIAGFYGMLDLPIVQDRLRFVGGVRLEYSYLTTTARLRTQGFVDTRLNDLDPLPAVNLICSPRDDMNVRLGFSETVSRPDFRELTPAQYPEPTGGTGLQGNPNLVSAGIRSYDLRWEWFFSPLELASVSFFYKELQRPIERVNAVSTSEVLNTFVNTDEATLWGFEIEGRKDFNFLVPRLRRYSWLKNIAPHLADLQLVGNVGVIESSVEGFTAPPDFTIAQPPGKTRLQGQSPYVINAAIEYENYRYGIFRLLYNTVAPTIESGAVDLQPGVESALLPEVVQERRDQLDFVWIGDLTPLGLPLSTKFSVENLLNDDYVRTQGDRVVGKYRTGLTFSIGVSCSF